MSISSIFAFVLASAAARTKSVQVARPSEEKRIAALEARIAELEGDVERANIQYRRDQDLIDRWRTRAFYAEARIGSAFTQEQAAAALQQQANLAQQYNAQQAMNAQNVYGQGLGQMLGAQQLSPLEWCNCVPARHDLFLKR
jgi:hypothetical protein